MQRLLSIAYLKTSMEKPCFSQMCHLKQFWMFAVFSFTDVWIVHDAQMSHPAVSRTAFLFVADAFSQTLGAAAPLFAALQAHVQEVLRRLRAASPTQRVVIMSGFSEQEAMQRCAELGVSEFMAKPFEIAALTEKFGGEA